MTFGGGEEGGAVLYTLHMAALDHSGKSIQLQGRPCFQHQAALE